MIYSLSTAADVLMSSAHRIANPWMLWRLHTFPENSHVYWFNQKKSLTKLWTGRFWVLHENSPPQRSYPARALESFCTHLVNHLKKDKIINTATHTDLYELTYTNNCTVMLELLKKLCIFLFHWKFTQNQTSWCLISEGVRAKLAWLKCICAIHFNRLILCTIPAIGLIKMTKSPPISPESCSSHVQLEVSAPREVL